MAEKTHLERTLETLVDLVDLARKQSNEKFDKLAASLDVLALNVGQLATQQKATASNIARMAERLDNSINRLITAVERQNSAIDGHLRLSEAQSVNIAELTRLATKLIDKAA